MRRVLLLVLLLTAPFPSISRGETPTAAGKKEKAAKITYVSGATVYLDAGREDGLTLGQTVQCRRKGGEVTTLTVMHLASHRASCVAAEADATLTLGEAVHFVPTEIAATTPVSTTTPRSLRARSGNWFRRNGLNGRVGFRFLSLHDLSGNGEDFTQPGLDLRLRGDNLGNGPYSVHVDVRTRRTYRTRSNGSSETDGRTRVYRLSAARDVASGGGKISLGRQTYGALSSVGIFDGALAQMTRGRLTAGAFAGTQPDAANQGYSTEIAELGIFSLWQERKLALSGGAVASYASGNLNREYLFFRQRITKNRFLGFASEEIDVNRGWKADAGEPAISLSNILVSLRYRLGDRWALSSGYDNRRNIRLYRNRISPETEFDDAYRQGWSTGLRYRPLSRLTVDLKQRHSGGATSGASDSYTVSLRANRLSPLSIALGSRNTLYHSPSVDGRLHSVNAGSSFGTKHHIRLELGLREEDRTIGEKSHNSTVWYGADLDLAVGRMIYFLLSMETTRSDVEENTQVYSSLTYRF